MKFIFALAPLASLSVLANGSADASVVYDGSSMPTNGIKFSEEGINNVLKASSKKGKEYSEAGGKSIKEFFDRNPSLVKSILKVSNDPKYISVKQDAMTKAMKLYSDSQGNLDFYSAGVKAANYVYSHPEFLEMLQKIGNQVLDDNPGGIDQFFFVFNKLVKKDPSLIHKIKKEAIDFSHDDEETYYKVFEMVVKYFTIRPRDAARIAIHALEADQIACSSSGSADCECNKETIPEAKGKGSSSVQEPEAEEPEIEEASTPENPEAEAEGQGAEAKQPELAYARPQ